MRVVNFLIAAFFAAIIVGLSVANRQIVEVNVAPDFTDYGVAASPSFGAPLYLIALLFAAIGFIIGTAREYLREGRIRRRSAERRRELGRLQQEVEELKSRANLDEDDEIIAMTSR